jgi:hypothetical protein
MTKAKLILNPARHCRDGTNGIAKKEPPRLHHATTASLVELERGEGW